MTRITGLVSILLDAEVVCALGSFALAQESEQGPLTDDLTIVSLNRQLRWCAKTGQSEEARSQGKRADHLDWIVEDFSVQSSERDC